MEEQTIIKRRITEHPKKLLNNDVKPDVNFWIQKLDAILGEEDSGIEASGLES